MFSKDSFNNVCALFKYLYLWNMQENKGGYLEKRDRLLEKITTHKITNTEIVKKKGGCFDTLKRMRETHVTYLALSKIDAVVDTIISERL